MRGNLLTILIAIAALTLPSMPPAQAREVPQYELRIERQSLSRALQEFAKQSGVQIIFFSKVTDGYEAPALSGKFTAATAVSRLLQDSPLGFRELNAKTIEVQQVQQVQPKAAIEAGETIGTSEVSRPATDGDIRLAQVQSVSPQAAPPSSESAGSEDPAEVASEVVVTGTHIRGAAPVGSPLMVITAEDLKQSGAATIDQYIRKLPQNFAQIDSGSYLNGLGGASEAIDNFGLVSAINLRGLGAGGTLVLLNGHRLAPAGVNGQFFDVTMVPASAVERIEILGDGASAIYGSDAVGGVVNFVLRDDMQGMQTTARYGAATEGGVDEYGLSQSLSFSSPRVHGMAVYEYFNQSALQAQERDLPVGPMRIDLSPQESRNSFFVSGGLKLTDATEVALDALHSTRDFAHDYFDVRSNVFSETDGTGTALLTNLTLAHDFPGQWRGEMIGSLSRTTEDRTYSFTGSTPGRQVNESDFWYGGLRADGPLFALPAGTVRASIGADHRHERFDPFDDRVAEALYSRDVQSVFGEIYVPVLAGNDGSKWLNRLALSLAGRYDRYSDVGGSTNPKVGLEWALTRSLALRSSYAESFRAPTLHQLYPDYLLYFTLPFPDPAAADGETVALVRSTSGNPGLAPELSRSFTAGLELKPAAFQNLTLSATYFRIDYTDRISYPPIVGSIFDIFSQLDTLGPFVDANADPAELQNIIDNAAQFFDFAEGEAPTAFFDTAPNNVASSRSEGLEMMARGSWQRGDHRFTGSFNANYFLELSSQVTPTASRVDLINTTYNPMDLRVRAGLAWARGDLSASFNLNYASDYQNNLVTPTGRVSAWTTGDLQLGWQRGGLQLMLNVDNLTDEPPPRLVIGNPELLNLGFDGTNATVRGRFVSVVLRKDW